MNNVHPAFQFALRPVAPPSDDLLDILAEASIIQRSAIVKLLNDGEFLLAGEALAAIVREK